MDNQNFNAKTEKIRASIIRMSDNVRFGFEETLKALESREQEAFETIPPILVDTEKDDEETESNIITCLALYAPEAGELRRMVAYFRIAAQLKKSSELIVKFSKRIKEYLEDDYYAELPMYKDLIELFKCVLVTIKLQNEACRAGFDYDYDACLERTKAEEGRSDDLFALMYKDIILSNYREEMYIKASIEIFNAGRRLERSADIAVETIEQLKYAKTGER